MTIIFQRIANRNIIATPGRVALIAAAIVLVAGLADLVRRQIRREFGWTAWCFVGLIAAAGALGAFALRGVTAGVGGANIGGGMLAFVGPVLIGGLLVLAVRLPPYTRPVPLAHPMVWTAAAALMTPALLAGFMLLRNHPSRRSPGRTSTPACRSARPAPRCTRSSAVAPSRTSPTCSRQRLAARPASTTKAPPIEPPATTTRTTGSATGTRSWCPKTAATTERQGAPPGTRWRALQDQLKQPDLGCLFH